MSMNMSPSGSTATSSPKIASPAMSNVNGSNGGQHGTSGGFNTNGITGLCLETVNSHCLNINGVKGLRWQRPNSIYADLMEQPQVRDSCLNTVAITDLKPDDSTFLLDLTSHGYPLKDFHTLHVSFPSTLLRRPRTTFHQLISTLHIETQALLKDRLLSSDHIVIYDEHSTLHRCNQQTCSVIMKLIPFLNEQNPSYTISLIEGGPSSFNKQRFPPNVAVPLPSFKISHPEDGKDNNGNSKHPNLKLHIPQVDESQISPNLISSASSTRMFIQSLKRGSIHYSPNSIKKYFVFHTPEVLPSHVPRWLSPYNTKNDSVVERIFEDFETLEALEVRRLEKCLMATNPSSNVNSAQNSNNNSSDNTNNSNNNNDNNNNNNNDTSSIRLPEKQSPHTELGKEYSLRSLQKEYKPNGNLDESDDDTLVMKHSNGSVDEKLRRDIKEELNDSNKHNLIGKLNTVSPGLLPVLKNDADSGITVVSRSSQYPDASDINASNFNEKMANSDEEVVETPLGNYQMTKGIQSFTKNRYSNILPYEHSRVRLQPSPLAEQLTLTSDQLSLLSAPKSGKYDNLTPGGNRRRELELQTVDENAGYFSQDSSPTRLYSHPANRSETTATSETDYDTEPFNDYFNANYLRLPQINPDFNYIATQAPLPSTIDDFWNVVLSKNLKVIISLNSYDELDMKKWDIYWNSKSIRKHEVKVTNTYEDVFDIPGCILRVMNVSKSDSRIQSPNKRTKFDQLPVKNESRPHTVYQLQYTKWLDSCGINMRDFIHIYHIKNLLLNDPASLFNALNNKTEDFLHTYRKLGLLSVNKNNSGSPVLVHCSAGCGRTGVFITLDFLLGVLDSRSNQSNKIDVWNMSADLIFIVVNELRKQRISMVQNLTQYLTCYESMLEFFYLKEHI